MHAFDLGEEVDALREAVRIAKARKTGARGLRAVLEAALTDTMFDAPSWKDVEKVVVTRECLLKKAGPTLVTARERTRRPSAA